MRSLIFAALLALVAGPVGAELVRLLEQDEAEGWKMTVPGRTASLKPADADDMTASLQLRPDGGEAISATVDTMGPLPQLLSVEEAYICRDRISVVVSAADISSEGHFIYRRWMFDEAGSTYIGEIYDEASAKAGGLLPAAVVARDMEKLCQ